MKYECSVCAHVYDEDAEGTPWGDLPDDWVCPICGAEREFFESQEEAGALDEPARPAAGQSAIEGYLEQWRRTSDDFESTMAVIHHAAVTGESVIEPMRSRKPVISWDEILVQGAQLARLPLNEDQPVSTRTVIGPGAEHPLVLDTPVYVSHMSFGALSREIKIALATGAAAARTATCSGEGGIVPESLAAAHRYIFEYVPNRYSVTEENLRAVDAVEIKIGQSAKPGLGGHLLGEKVTEAVAAMRETVVGSSLFSPFPFHSVYSVEDHKKHVDWMKEINNDVLCSIKAVSYTHLRAHQT